MALLVGDDHRSVADDLVHGRQLVCIVDPLPPDAPSLCDGLERHPFGWQWLGQGDRLLERELGNSPTPIVDL